MKRVAIIGTGLIGASIGLALKSTGFTGHLLGWDTNPSELEAALHTGAIDQPLPSREAVLQPGLADIYLLATPVLPILDWMQRLAPILNESQLVTDVGSTKLEIVRLAQRLYNGPNQAVFLPGHPMAGKETGGAALAEASLFQGATWLFTPLEAQLSPLETQPLEAQWRALVQAFGAHTRDIDPVQHDEVCAFAADPNGLAALQAIGGRALRETTRLGSSPYSMWRDVALTNTSNVAATLLALEQRLQHIRENLRTPELREEFTTANRFRVKR
jgi:prephenate dehydrogenase